MRSACRRRVSGRGENAVEDLGFAPHVELSCRLVEDDDAGPGPDGAKGSCQRDTLPLTARQVGPAFVSAGKDRIERRQVGGATLFERFTNGLVRRASGRHILAQRQLEPREVLEERGQSLLRRHAKFVECHAVRDERVIVRPHRATMIAERVKNFFLLRHGPPSPP